jgi:hypothetical protein
MGQKHDFNGTPTSGSTTATGTQSQASGSAGAQGTQAADASAMPSTTGAADNLNRSLKAVGAVLVGAVAVFAWL